MEWFLEAELLVNITEHVLVPHHQLLSKEEKAILLKKYRMKEAQLPRMQLQAPLAPLPPALSSPLAPPGSAPLTCNPPSCPLPQKPHAPFPTSAPTSNPHLFGRTISCASRAACPCSAAVVHPSPPSFAPPLSLNYTHRR